MTTVKISLLCAVAATVMTSSNGQGFFADFPAAALDGTLAALVIPPSRYHRSMRHLQVPDDLVVTSCADATEFFRGNFDRFFNGTNVFQEVFDCQCVGDFASKFNMTCIRRDYCSEAQTPASLIDYEICVKEEKRTFEFEINSDTGFLDSYNRLVHCVDFADDGSPQSLASFCHEFNPYCAITLRRAPHYLNSAQVKVICGNTDGCRPTFELWGYPRENATALCPNVTLNDRSCKAYAGDVSQTVCERDFGEGYLSTPDCSNIEGCATPTCYLRNGSNVDTAFPPFPNCIDGIQTVPFESPPTVQSSSCRDAVGTEGRFDECLYEGGGFVLFGTDDNRIRECRECIMGGANANILADHDTTNCTEYVDAACSSFTACAASCGPCIPQAYELFQCVATNLVDGLANCVLECSVLPASEDGKVSASSQRSPWEWIVLVIVGWSNLAALIVS